MTQKEIDLKTEKVLEESILKVIDIIKKLKDTSTEGPVMPAIERLSEAGFWLNACLTDMKERNEELYNKNSEV